MSFSRLFGGLRRRVLRRLLRQSPAFFDESYFRDAYPELIALGPTPVEAYVQQGFARNLKPNFYFDPEFYVATMPKALRGQIDPAIHYLAWGRHRDYDPHPLFDLDYYYGQMADRAEPIGDFITIGWRGGLSPTPIFQTRYYLGKYPDIAAAGFDPFRHYLEGGAIENRRPNPVFSPGVHSRRNGDMPLAEATLHYMNSAPAAEIAAIAALTPIAIHGKPRSVREWCLETGRQVIDFDYPRKVEWQAYRTVEDAGPVRILKAELPPAYVAVMEDCLCFPGTELIVSADGDILHDEMTQDPQLRYNPKTDAVARVTKDECVVLSALSPDALDEAILISTHADFNYFHAMIEFLPKFMMTEKIGIPETVPLAIQAGLHPNIREAIARVAGNRPVLEYPLGSGVRVSKLWYHSDLSRILDNLNSPVAPDFDMVVDPAAVRFTARRILGDAPPPKATRKLYLARTSDIRLLDNEKTLMEQLAARGFEMLDTAKMDLQRQIETFRQAKQIVAPTGAALTNLLWCQPGTASLVLVSDNLQCNFDIYTQLAQALEQELTICIGKRLNVRSGLQSVHDDFETDIPGVLRWCDAQANAAVQAVA